MKTCRLLPTLACASLTALLFALPSRMIWAQTEVQSTANLAFVGGTPILRVRTPWIGLTPEQRADKVQERVNSALGQGPIWPQDITVGQVQGDWCVLFRGRRLLTADAASGRFHHSNPEELATEWASRMRHVLPDLTKPKG